MIRKNAKALVAVAAVVVLVAVGLGAWLLLGGDAETRASDRCGDVTYELAVEEEDQGLEVSFELQSAAPGETWTVLVERGGEPVLEGERQTDEDAELDVDVTVPAEGPDDFTATATQAGGEPCTAELSHG